MRLWDKCYVVERLLVVTYEKVNVAKKIRYDVGLIDPQTHGPIKDTSRSFHEVPQRDKAMGLILL